MATQGAGRHHTDMNERSWTKSTVTDRLLYVMERCGYRTKTALSRAMGVSLQNLNVWERRGKLTAAGALAVQAATGASLDWLIASIGEPFPNGPKPAAGGAELALVVERLENDVDVLRLALAAVVEALTATSPAAADGLLALLMQAEDPLRSHDLAVQLHEIAAARRNAAAGQPGASRRAAGTKNRRASSS